MCPKDYHHMTVNSKVVSGFNDTKVLRHSRSRSRTLLCAGGSSLIKSSEITWPVCFSWLERCPVAEGLQFVSWSRHIPRLWVHPQSGCRCMPSPVQVPMIPGLAQIPSLGTWEDDQLMHLLHQCFSLALCLSPFLKANEKKMSFSEDGKKKFRDH